MRKKTLLFIGIFSLGILSAQVGVNTNNPLGVFHIDPLANTTTLNAATYSDDIVVTKEGNVGIGTILPTTKLDIRTGGTGLNPVSGLSIQDGSEGKAKVLVTESSDGKASWRSVPGSWYAILSGGDLPYQSSQSIVLIPFTSGVFSKNVPGASFNISQGIVTLPYKGMYRVTISGKVNTNRTVIDGAYIAMFRVNFGAEIKAPHCMVSKDFGDAFVSFSFFLDLNAGETVQLALSPTATTYANRVLNAQMLVEYIQGL